MEPSLSPAACEALTELLGLNPGLLFGLLEEAFDGFAIHDGVRIMYLNGRLAELFGYSREDMLGRSLSDFASPESKDPTDTTAPAEPAACSMQDVLHEAIGVRKSGERFHVEIGSRPFVACPAVGPAPSGPILRLTTVRDVTARKLAERKLRESEASHRATLELFESTFEQAAVGVLHTDPSGRCIRANRRFGELVGRDLSEVVAGDFRSCLYPEDVRRAEEGYAPLLSGQAESFCSELRLLHRDGSAPWVFLTTSVVRGPEGNPKYFVTIVQDISGRKEAEDTLLEHRMRLFQSSKMSALGVMASGIAHEVNNPLAIIRSYANVIRETVANPEVALQPLRETVAESIERIDSTAVRITRIVRSLMGFARDSERDELQRVEVRAILADALDLCSMRLKASGIDVECDPGPECLSIECKRVPISQVMLNLLSNAVDAVEAAQKPGPRWIRVSAREAGNQLELWVEDNGIGIAPELREQVMEPFFTTKGEGRGTGLGLSISRKIVESHRGTLSIDASAPHTRFVVRLPKPRS